MKDINNGSDEETSDNNEETEVKSGNLTVSFEESDTKKDVPSNGTVIIDTLNFKANEDVTVRSITIATDGMTKQSNIDTVWFETEDGKKIGTEKTLSSDGTATVKLGKGYTVKKGESLNLVANLKGESGIVAFKLTAIDSTAEKVKQSNETTAVCTLVNYTVTEATFEAINDGTEEIKLGEKSENVLGTFKIKNPNTDGEKRAITVKNITLENMGQADLDNLSNIVVKRDGKTVSKDVSIEKDKLTIVLNDEIAAGNTYEYTIYATVDTYERTTDSYQFRLDEVTDLIIDETKSEFRITPTFVNSSDTMTEYTINGGKIRLVSNSESSVTVSKGGEAIIASGIVNTTSAFDVRKNADGYSLAIDITDAGKAEWIEDADLLINGQPESFTVNTNDSRLEVKSEISFKKGENKIAVRVKIKDEDYVIESESISFGKISAASFSDQGIFSDADVKTNNFTAEISSSISVSKVDINKAKFTLDRNGSLEKLKYVQSSSNAQPYSIFSGVLANNKSDTVTLKQFIISEKNGTTLAAKDEIEFTLKINGEAEKSQTMRGTGSIIMKDFGTIKLAAGESIKVEIIAEPTIDNLTDTVNGDKYEYQLEVKGSNATTNNSDLISADPEKMTMSSITVIAKGEVNPQTTSSVKKNLVFAEGTKTAVAEYVIEIKNESMKVKSLEIGTENIDEDTMSNVSMTYKKANGTEDTLGTLRIKSEKLTMEDVDTTLDPATYHFYVYVTSSDLEDKLEDVTLKTMTINFEGRESKTEFDAITTNDNFVHKIYEVVPVISHKESDANKRSYEAMILTITNPSNDTITIESFAFEGTSAANVEVKAPNSEIIDGTKTYAVNGKSSASFIVQAKNGGAFAQGQAVSVTLKGIDYKVNNNSYSLTKDDDSSITDHKVSYFTTSN